MRASARAAHGGVRVILEPPATACPAQGHREEAKRGRCTEAGLRGDRRPRRRRGRVEPDRGPPDTGGRGDGGPWRSSSTRRPGCRAGSRDARDGTAALMREYGTRLIAGCTPAAAARRRRRAGYDTVAEAVELRWPTPAPPTTSPRWSDAALRRRPPASSSPSWSATASRCGMSWRSPARRRCGATSARTRRRPVRRQGRAGDVGAGRSRRAFGSGWARGASPAPRMTVDHYYLSRAGVGLDPGPRRRDSIIGLPMPEVVTASRPIGTRRQLFDEIGGPQRSASPSCCLRRRDQAGGGLHRAAGRRPSAPTPGLIVEGGAAPTRARSPVWAAGAGR
jgi:hypothetical protein